MGTWFKKIAFSGSHGVGKTTLLNAVKEFYDLSNSQIVEETATRVFEMSKDNPALEINQGATLEAQLHIIGIQLEEEARKFKYEMDEYPPRYKLGICDRSSIDALVYTYHRIRNHPQYRDLFMTLLPKLCNWIVDNTVAYDVLFYIPITFKLESNEVRPDDMQFQEDIDDLMQDLLLHGKLGDIKVPIKDIADKVVVVSGSHERRMRIVQRHLSGFDLIKEK
jgi:GTPase SAR1 family protein